MAAVSLEDIDRRLERMETLMARLVDCVLTIDDPGEYFDPALLARDILARGAVAMKEHNQRRQAKVSRLQAKRRST